MAKITFLRPIQQSAYSVCKDEIKLLKTSITVNIKNIERDFEKLNADVATKHDKKRYLQAINFKMESMHDMFNGLSTMTTKAIAILSTAPLEDPEQKNFIEREEKDLQTELEQFTVPQEPSPQG